MSDRFKTESVIGFVQNMQLYLECPFSPKFHTLGRSESGRKYALTIRQQSCAHGSANGKYEAVHGKRQTNRTL